MLSGLLSSLKNQNHHEVTNVVDQFDQLSSYQTSGYTSTQPIDDDNVNIIGQINEKVEQNISKGISKGIDFMFELVKKLVS